MKCNVVGFATYYCCVFKVALHWEGTLTCEETWAAWLGSATLMMQKYEVAKRIALKLLKWVAILDVFL